MTQTLSQLENRGAFIERHIGPGRTAAGAAGKLARSR